MDEHQLYEQILDLPSPWCVDDVRLNKKNGNVDIFVTCDIGDSVCCPKCKTQRPRYDSRKRSWRHLDTCQYQTIIHANIPRVECPSHGVIQIETPWAQQNSRFTSLFESLIIDWLKEASINAVSRRFELSWNAVDGIMSRSVKRGLSNRKRSSYKHLAVDEVSSKKGHQYVTIVSNEQGNVIEVIDDRKKESLASFYNSLSTSDISKIETVSMDMSQAYVFATKECIDGWEAKICFDRFHVMQDLNKAVNQVRKSELKFLPVEFREPLHRSRFCWLRSEATLQENHKNTIRGLQDIAVKTARACSIRQYAGAIWDYQSRVWATKAWMKWYGWAIRSRLSPIRTVAKSIKKNLWGIVNAIIYKKNNAGAEGINSQIKILKVKARGFRNKERFKSSILFHFGGLDLYPKMTPT